LIGRQIIYRERENEKLIDDRELEREREKEKGR